MFIPKDHYILKGLLFSEGVKKSCMFPVRKTIFLFHCPRPRVGREKFFFELFSDFGGPMGLLKKTIYNLGALDRFMASDLELNDAL